MAGLAANQWACIEVAFIADKSPHELQAWVGGTLVHSITTLDQWQNGTIKSRCRPACKQGRLGCADSG